MKLDKRYSGDSSLHASKTIQKSVKLTEEEINIVKNLLRDINKYLI